MHRISSGRCVNWATQLRLMPNLRSRGARRAFVEWTGTCLPSLSVPPDKFRYSATHQTTTDYVTLTSSSSFTRNHVAPPDIVSHCQHRQINHIKTGTIELRNTEALSCNHFWWGKPICIIPSGCVSIALFTQDAKRMRHVILSSVTCLALPYFPTFSMNNTIFFEN